MKNKYIIFDLDDTLMYEIDFLKSAYFEIAEKLDKNKQTLLYDTMISKYQEGENVFDYLVNIYSNISKEQLLEMYRNHFPNIQIDPQVSNLLQECKLKKYKLGLITDGRSVTQRNKLKALGIENSFDKVVVSEEFGSTKPDERNFIFFIESYIEEYIYIADNPLKDFVIPNKLGWKSICLLSQGQNVHPQNFDIPNEFLPQLKIKSINEVINYL